MPDPVSPLDRVRPLLRTRQVREFTDEPLADDELAALADVARWSGSAGNSQLWRFIVIRDTAALRRLADVAAPQTRSLQTAMAAIAIVLPAGDRQLVDAYDDGRVAERVLVGAGMLGLAAGIASSPATTSGRRSARCSGCRRTGTSARSSRWGTPPMRRSARRVPRARHACHATRSCSTTAGLADEAARGTSPRATASPPARFGARGCFAPTRFAARHPLAPAARYLAARRRFAPNGLRRAGDQLVCISRAGQPQGELGEAVGPPSGSL